MAEVQKPILPTRLYRYRSLTRSRDALRQEIESIRENYLYCSEFTRMNDPMEGFYQPSEVLKGTNDYKKIVGRIKQGKTELGIACFTETYQDALMWTHYAGNYAGLCLCYATRRLVKGLSDEVKLVRLAYVDEPPLIYPSHVRNVHEAAIRILSQKKYNWAYEREWRILGRVGPLALGKAQAVEAIYFGSRVNLHDRRQILAKIRGTKIKAYMMKVDGYKHSFKLINSVAASKES